MKKIIRLSESELTNMVKKVISESKNDRVVYGSQISNKSNLKFMEEGYIPYYLDLKKDGDYKIVKVSNLLGELPKTTFYFLNEHELALLQKLTDNINNIISGYISMIGLYKKQLIGILEQKIIK